MSACSASRCELTETYSPAAIDSAPATSPAIPAVTIAAADAPDAATPSTRLAVDRMPSLAPSTAARSQLERWLRWTSGVDDADTARPYRSTGGAPATAYGAQCSVAAASSPARMRSTPPRREEPTTMSSAPSRSAMVRSA